MNTVNPWFLDRLLSPLIGLGDDDEAARAYSSVNPNDEVQMREIIRRTIVPYSYSLPPQFMDHVKLAYQYYLSQRTFPFGDVFYSGLLPFNAPSDPRLFFVWIWEEVFPGEKYELPNFSEYKEKPDIHEPGEIYSKYRRPSPKA